MVNSKKYKKEYAAIRGYLEGRETYEQKEIEIVLKEVRLALNWCSSQIDKKIEK